LLKDAEERVKTGKARENGESGEAAEILSKKSKVGPHKARQAIDLVTHGKKADVKRVIAGKASLAEASANAKSAKRKKNGKPRPKPKEVDKTSQEFVVKKFQRFLDYWAATQLRTVKDHIREFLSVK
jgi:hypothetical protein